MFTRRQMMVTTGASLVLSACATPGTAQAPLSVLGTIGAPESFDPRFDALIAPDTPVQIVAEGFDWSEGPAWDMQRERLLFSDVPQNQMFAWSRREGLTTYLEPAGAPHDKPYADAKRGTNGLWYVKSDDSLLICNQSGRSIDRLNLATGERENLIDNDGGIPLNRPNDIVAKKDGTIFFTNPNYGLDGSSPSAEQFLEYNGVYRLGADGMSLITKDLATPNGIILSPDERILYVAQSGSEAPMIMRYYLDEAGMVTGSDLFFDVKAHPIDGVIGRGDGMAVDKDGNIYFCAVTTGMLVISPEGDMLGRVATDRRMSNCVFGEDGSVLFITADDLILRVQTRTMGTTFT